jgi:cell wall-associated NlpC family hydrolase
MKAGIDPAQVVAVMGKEGPTGWGSVGTFDTGSSYGPLQLHYAGGSNPKEGMGDRFTKATGIDLRKDSSVQAHQAAVDFAMGELAKRGDFSEWYGADNAFPAAQGGQGRFTKVNRVAPSQSAPQGGQPSAGGLDVAGITKAYAGVPYTFGGPGGRGQGLGATTDCSGFVSAVWKSQYGLDLPAHTDAAYNALKQQGAVELSQADARPGDVVFYMGAGTGGAITHHMGVYQGGGQVLDMSTSGGSGVRSRPVGHGGQFVILRDPRLSSETPQSAAPPQPIVQTGVAERTGGQKLPQAQVDALSNRPVGQPTAGEPGGGELAPGPVWSAPPPAETAPFQDTYEPAAVAPPIHANVARAFEAANGRPPTPEEAAELASLGFA